jgi:hypothetical protein
LRVGVVGGVVVGVDTVESVGVAHRSSEADNEKEGTIVPSESESESASTSNAESEEVRGIVKMLSRLVVIMLVAE